MDVWLLSVYPARQSAYTYHHITEAASSALFVASEGSPEATSEKLAFI